MRQRPLYLLGSVLLATVIFIIAVNFAVSDRLSGFSTDSATYLMMAEIYSPYQHTAPAAFHDSLREFRYLPPGFPVMLAITGAYQDIVTSHLMVIIQFTLALLVIAFLYKDMMKDRIAAYAALMIFSLLPGIWMELLKIMSESQYLLLSMIYLLIYNRYHRNVSRQPLQFFLLGILAATIYLTRSIGLAIIIATLLQQFIQHRKHGLVLTRNSLALLAGFTLPVLVWQSFKPVSDSSYLSDFLIFTTHKVPLTAFATMIIENLSAFYSSWLSNLMIYWLGYTDPRFYIGSLFIPLMVIGLYHRRKESDGLYFSIYMIILMVWPYPAEMHRFFLPVLPLLLAYTVLGLLTVAQKTPFRNTLLASGLTLLTSLPVPAQAFLLERHEVARHTIHGDLSHSSIIYNELDISRAMHLAMTWEEYMLFFSNLKKIVPGNSLIIGLKPEFITYLSHLRSVNLPPTRDKTDKALFVQKVQKSGANYILLTDISTLVNPDGTDAISMIHDLGEISFIGKYRNKERIKLVLLKLTTGPGE